MNILEILLSIWSVRGRALLIALVAVVVAVLFTFRVSLSPLSIEPSALQFGVANTQLLVNARNSPLGNANIPLTTLNDVAEDYAEVIDSPAVIAPVARVIGVSPDQVGVQEQVNVSVPLATSDEREPQVGVQLLASKQRYHVLVRNDAGTFVLQIFTQAPTSRQAARMASAVAESLSKYAADADHGSPGANQVALQQLGAIRGGAVGSGASRDAAILVGITVWILGMVALLTVRRQHRLRSRVLTDSPAPRTEASTT